jgi:phospholipid/cholesterol/gamma-HCH transport system substrate-binding protein
MKSRKIEILVGLFVVLGIASLLMLALQVSGLTNFYRPNHTYVLKAEFSNIGGLKVRGKVTISGVTIGRVADIQLVRNSYGDYAALVTLAIEKNIKDIPDDSSAKILTAGLLGDNYVAIIPGQSEMMLHDGSSIELTSQAVLLEDLIAKFVTGPGSNPSSNSSSSSGR